ncbi:MAG TPA: hypothetical protein VGC82_04155, partial [Rhodopila sp.]
YNSPQWTTQSSNVLGASVAPEGLLFAERRNRGYTLYSVQSGALVARLRPTGSDDSFEIFYWSLWKNRWASTGRLAAPSCRSVTPQRFITYGDIFWAMT